jgi:hypothetical protein
LYPVKSICRFARWRCRIYGKSAFGFEGAFEDIFNLQDRVTQAVVGAIGPKLEQTEIERSRRKPTGSLDAYDYYLRGIANYYPATREDAEEMLRPSTISASMT